MILRKLRTLDTAAFFIAMFVVLCGASAAAAKQMTPEQIKETDARVKLGPIRKP